MSEDQQHEQVPLEGAPAVRSGVRIEVNAKLMPQPKIAVYEGTTEEEMQRLLDIAVLTLEATARRLGIQINTAT